MRIPEIAIALYSLHPFTHSPTRHSPSSSSRPSSTTPRRLAPVPGPQQQQQQPPPKVLYSWSVPIRRGGRDKINSCPRRSGAALRCI
ncbi:hypothetical protein V9T40_004771 [Parthenolecanium corni]|uniref:Uncharacterized protein n=1 Tax=Parthenolecanium corni TaxID=536013 RepID=A0AAN9TGW3_9HEMI